MFMLLFRVQCEQHPKNIAAAGSISPFAKPAAVDSTCRPLNPPVSTRPST